MLQNSNIFTVYGRSRGSLAERLPPVAQTVQAIREQYGVALAGVTMEIHLIERPGWETEQNGPLRVYWTEVFNQLGIAVSWQAIPVSALS